METDDGAKEQQMATEITGTDGFGPRFAELFRERYLSSPFASLTKGETDYVLFSCLVDSGYLDRTDPVFTIAQKLRVTPTKAKNLLYQYDLRTMNDRESDQTAALASAIVVVGFTESDDSEKEILTLGIENAYLRDVLIARLKKAGVFTDTRFNRELIQVKLYRFVGAFRTLFPDSAYDDVIAELEVESARKKGRSKLHSLLSTSLSEVATTTLRTGTAEALKALPLAAILAQAFARR
jgi:hypothetical protein